MVNRRTVISWLKASAVAIFISLAVGGVAHADDAAFAGGAKTFVENLTGEAIRSLAVKDIDKQERRDRFRKLMLDKFAFQGIAKWVLGRYWRRASNDEKAQFLKLYEDLLVITYADRFEQYAGEKIVVGKSEIRGGKDALVHSQLIRGEGVKAIDVTWRVRKKDDNFKIVDVMVEGLSMGLTQQKEFASVIRKNGGKVIGLIDELRKRLKSNT